ncbi:MAG: helix-turn-helix domain-containing protein [Lachnospirales bacterium]
MFERIPFISIRKNRITPIKYLNEMEELNIISNDFLDSFNADFILNDISFIQPTPISETSLERLLYLQAFTLINGDSTYYTKREKYNSFLISYTYSGTGYLEYDNKEYTLEKGMGFLIDCRKKHFYKTKGEQWGHYDLHFNGIDAEYLVGEYNKYKNIIFEVSGKGYFYLTLEKILWDYSIYSNHKELYVSNGIANLLVHLIKKKENTYKNNIPEYIQYLVKYIDNNFYNRLTIDDLSRFSGVSKYHLIREFKKYTNFTPTDYIIELRIERAKLLLQNTTIPSYKIGNLVGFHNTNNFTNLFKKRVGTTPNVYRKGLQ